MDWTHALVVLVFALAGCACLLAIPIGLPGTWILLALAALVELGDGVLVRGAAAPISDRLAPDARASRPRSSGSRCASSCRA